MKITENRIDELNATIKIELVKEDYITEVDKTLKDFQKRAAIDGFRKGKVPMGVVRKMYGKSVLVDELNKKISSSLHDYLKEKNVDILGEPLPSLQDGEEQDLDKENFEFLYDIAYQPDMNVDMTKREKIPYYKIIVTEEMMNKQIEYVCKSNGEMQDVDTIEDGEYITADIVELEAGKPKEGGIVREDVSMSIEHMKDEASKEAFKGKKLDEKVIFNPILAYPNKTDLSSMLGISKEELDNISSEFEVTIKTAKRHFSAKLDQELFDKLYGEGNVTTEADFRDKIKEDIDNQLLSNSEYRFTIDARDKLIKKNEEVVLPEAFLKRWIMATNENIKEEEVEADFEGYREEFKWQMIKNAIIKKYEIKLGEEDIKLSARALAAAQLQQYGLFGLTDEQLDGFAVRLLEDEKQRTGLYEKTKDDKVFETVKEHIKMEEKEISKEDFEKLFS